MKQDRDIQKEKKEFSKDFNAIQKIETKAKSSELQNINLLLKEASQKAKVPLHPKKPSKEAQPNSQIFSQQSLSESDCDPALKSQLGDAFEN